MIQNYHLGLIGYPLSHSLSPRIHLAALHALNLPGDYELFTIPPLPDGRGELVGLLQRIRSEEIQGLNITIPHKQSVLDLVDELTPTARSVGAVNTLLLQDNSLLGENTDAAGFLSDLRYNSSNVAKISITPPASDVDPDRTALVLGAGGSARAVVYALLMAGYELIIAARRVEQAQQLVNQFSTQPNQVSPGSLKKKLSAVQLDVDNLATLDQKTSSPVAVIVNCTPLGMVPDVNASPWPEGVPLPPGSLIYDLIYNPMETQLIRQARQAGLQAYNGLGMLVEQAALAFELWTGREAPRSVMREAAAGS